VRRSPVNKNTKPNFSESFYITRDRAPDHPDIVNNKPLVGLNRWPEHMPEFRTATAYRARSGLEPSKVRVSSRRSEPIRTQRSRPCAHGTSAF